MLRDVLRTYPLRFIDMAENMGYYWFSACNFNGLFKADLLKGTVEYVGKFPEDKENALQLHSAVVAYKSKLFFCPMYSENIVEYDIYRNKFTYYRVSESKGRQAYCGVGQYKSFIFFWNYKWDAFDTTAVFRFDMETKQIMEVKIDQDSLSEQYVENSGNEEKIKLGRNFCIVDNNIYISSAGKGAVMQIDMWKNVKKIHILSGEKELRTICHVKGKFLLTNTTNQIIEWEKDGNVVRHILIDKVPIGKAGMGVFSNNRVYYTLVESEKLLILDLENKKFEFVEMHEGKNKYQGFEDFMSGSIMFKADGNRVWLLSNKYSMLQSVEGKEISCHALELRGNIEKFIYDRVRSYFSNYKVLQEKESEMLGLEELIVFISLNRCDSVYQKDKNKNLENKYMES